MSSGLAPPVHGVSALGVVTILSSPPSHTSHAQPEPNRPTAAALKASTNLSRPPKVSSILTASSPSGLPPPPGFMQFQKKVWFHTWAALLKSGALSA